MTRAQQHRYILGSDAYLTLVTDQDPEPIFAQLWNYLETFQHRFSRFEPASELSRFNKRAGQWQTVSPAFGDLLQACQTLAAATDGLFNPFILPALQSAGYKGSWPEPQQAKPKLDMSGRRVVDPTQLELKDGRAQIPANSALDFGGIGKGYALDQLGKLLSKLNVGDYWLSLGGDILCRGYDTGKTPWQVDIVDAHQSEKTVAVCTNQDGQPLAIATSGITKRRGSGWHHLIDPRTGQPSKTPISTATAITDNATKADVLAKCLVLDPAGRYTIKGGVLQYIAVQPPDIIGETNVIRVN